MDSSREISDGMIPNLDYISITGNGFLQNMVRIITGTLIEVGLGKREADSVKETLEQKDRTQAGYTVSPKGLALVEVNYD